jgi:hypothetical protein
VNPLHRAPPASFEALEDRRLFSFTIIISSNPPPPDIFGSPVNILGLPQPALGLPSGALGLPGPGSPAVAPPRDIRGAYRGGAQLPGFGGIRLRVNIDTQSANVVTGSIRVPALGVSVSGTATVSFFENRRFTFTLSQGSDAVNISGRANRDGTVTGTVALVSNGLRRDGTFGVTKVA